MVCCSRTCLISFSLVIYVFNIWYRFYYVDSLIDQPKKFTIKYCNKSLEYTLYSLHEQRTAIYLVIYSYLQLLCCDPEAILIGAYNQIVMVKCRNSVENKINTI